MSQRAGPDPARTALFIFNAIHEADTAENGPVGSGYGFLGPVESYVARHHLYLLSQFSVSLCEAQLGVWMPARSGCVHVAYLLIWFLM